MKLISVFPVLIFLINKTIGITVNTLGRKNAVQMTNVENNQILHLENRSKHESLMSGTRNNKHKFSPQHVVDDLIDDAGRNELENQGEGDENIHKPKKHLRRPYKTAESEDSEENTYKPKRRPRPSKHTGGSEFGNEGEGDGNTYIPKKHTHSHPKRNKFPQQSDADEVSIDTEESDENMYRPKTHKNTHKNLHQHGRDDDTGSSEFEKEGDSEADNPRKRPSSYSKRNNSSSRNRGNKLGDTGEGEIDDEEGINDNRKHRRPKKHRHRGGLTTVYQKSHDRGAEKFTMSRR